MSVQYKIIITRPNLSSLFWIEQVYNVDPPVKWPEGTMPPELEELRWSLPIVPMLFPAWLPENYSDHNIGNKAGFVSMEIADLLTWNEIIARQDELRSDLQDMLDSEAYTIYMRDSSHLTVKPPFNPFSLTWTATTTWDTLENMQNGIFGAFEELSLVSLWNDAITNTNNTLVEEVWVDGVKQTGISFFS